MTLNDIRKLAAADLQQLDALLVNRLESKVQLINTVSAYVIKNQGKRIRPLVLILASKALGYTGKHHLTLAAVAELIHTSTLLHDDVVDESRLRRGQETANARWNNSASVLVGDFLYSRSFQLMVEPKNMAVIELLSDTTNRIAEGEVLQLIGSHNANLTESTYFQVIDAKTGALFNAVAVMAGQLADASSKQLKALSSYGTHLGRAFQVTDDMLDYEGDIQETGKHIGDDLKEGKNTLPLIVAIERAEVADAEFIRQAITNGEAKQVDRLVEILRATKALDYCREVAQDAVNQAVHALDALPENAFSAAMKALAEGIPNRRG